MPIDCPKCFGSGGGPDPATSCNVCEGTGRVEPDPLVDARESLVILEDLERFLIVDIGQSDNLTLANAGQWADQIADVREKIATQKAMIAKLRSEP